MSRPLAVREHVRIAYLLSDLFVVDPDGGEREASEVAASLGTLWIVTAWNPYSRKRDLSANEAAHQALLEHLDSSGIDHLPALGCSPRRDWCEPSVALIGVGSRRARAVGRTLHQNAVFEVTATHQVVHGSHPNWSRSRAVGTPWQPAPYSSLTLGEVTAAELGVAVERPFWRFRQAGWRLDGNTGLPCDACGDDLWLCSALLRAKDGTWHDAKAIVCPTCATVRLPGHLPPELRTAVYAWADWRIGVEDAAQNPAERDDRRCYVIDLVDPTDTKLPTDRRSVYVGETGLSVEARLAQHLAGTKSSRWTRSYATDLAWDLMKALPTHATEAESKAYEAYLAARLRLLGYEVKGGH